MATGDKIVTLDGLKAVYDSINPRIADLEAIIAANQSRDWQTVQSVVRAGLGPAAYPVGTQFQVRRATAVSAALGTHTGITDASVDEETFLGGMGNVGSGVHTFIFQQGVWQYGNAPVDLTDYGITVTGTAAAGDEIIVTETYQTILFDVVDHRTVTDPVTSETGPGMVLMMHNVFPNLRFNASQAIYYAEEALPAGAYCFTAAGRSSSYSSDNGKTFYFTLTQAVPAGGQIALAVSTTQSLAGKSVTTYASVGSTTAIESTTLSATEISGAVSLGTTDGAGALNSMDNITYGSNNYSQSALRKFINSGAASGWWEPSGDYDRPPTTMIDDPGLLHGMDADFLSAVGAVSVPVKPSGAAYTVTDKFFAPSRVEVGDTNGSSDEGAAFAFYANAENADRVKRGMADMSAAKTWWLRSPASTGTTYAYQVSSSGSVSGRAANTNSFPAGPVAACVIY